MNSYLEAFGLAALAILVLIGLYFGIRRLQRYAYRRRLEEFERNPERGWPPIARPLMKMPIPPEPPSENLRYGRKGGYPPMPKLTPPPPQRP